MRGNGLDSVIEAQQAAHQSCLAKMGPGGQESCSYAPDPRALWHRNGLRSAWALGARGVYSGGDKVVQAHARLTRVTMGD